MSEPSPFLLILCKHNTCKQGSFARFVGNDPYEKLLEDDVELVKNLIKRTYGVSKDQNNKIEHKIILEDPNLIKV